MEKTDRRCVIIGGADIADYDKIRNHLGADDYVIYCDSGLNHVAALGRMPDLIVGDFDSHSNPDMDVETIVLPCEKNDTDTVFAVKEAIKRGYKRFLLAGVIGARIDHTLGNVYILEYLDELGLMGEIIDDYSELELVSREPAYIADSYAFFSLINITGTAKGVTIENAKYPLRDAEITCGYQYGVSNEVVPGKTAKVTVKEGKLLLIKDRV